MPVPGKVKDYFSKFQIFLGMRNALPQILRLNRNQTGGEKHGDEQAGI